MEPVKLSLKLTDYAQLWCERGVKHLLAQLGMKIIHSSSSWAGTFYILETNKENYEKVFSTKIKYKEYDVIHPTKGKCKIHRWYHPYGLNKEKIPEQLQGLIEEVKLKQCARIEYLEYPEFFTSKKVFYINDIL